VTPREIYDRIVAEEIYVKFKWENFGYEAGDVVKAKLKSRDDKGVHVTIWIPDDGECGNAWSDLGSFRELNEMEVIAHFAAGLAVL